VLDLRLGLDHAALDRGRFLTGARVKGCFREPRVRRTILFLLKRRASFNRVRVLVVMDAGRTTPLVKVQSLFSCVPLVQRLLPNSRGQALNLCPASKRRLIMLEKS
jgi:hypothetical protein